MGKLKRLPAKREKQALELLRSAGFIQDTGDWKLTPVQGARTGGNEESMLEMLYRIFIPRYDYALHLISGVTIAVSCALFKLDILYIIMVTGFIGVGKEVLWDWLLGKGNADPRDALWVVAGAIFIVLAINFYCLT